MAAKRLPPPKYHLCGERRLAASECRQAPFPPILKIPSPSASPLSAGGHCGSLVDHMPPAAKSTLSRECHLYVMVAINMGEKVGNLPLEPLATIAGHAICRYAPATCRTVSVAKRHLSHSAIARRQSSVRRWPLWVASRPHATSRQVDAEQGAPFICGGSYSEGWGYPLIVNHHVWRQGLCPLVATAGHLSTTCHQPPC